MTVIAILMAAALVAAVVRNQNAAQMSEEIRCEGCFWENHCNNKDGMKICVEGHNGWEDAPWEKV